MKVCGVVCEYNPFHYGHLYHLNQVRLSADAVVCVMSGNFVQRGEPAIVRKHLRAENAVRGGADLVIELPTPWVLSSAERFANGAVSLLTAIPELTTISFGVETNNIKLMQKIADFLISDVFFDKIKPYLASGMTFAAAREKAVSELSVECAEILREPNNILAVEYIKALQNKRKIELFPVKRHQIDHDSTVTSDEYSSASNIRNLWKQNDFTHISDFLPFSDSYLEEIDAGHCPVFADAFSRIVPAALKGLDSDDFLRFADVGEGLQFRIKEALQKTSTLHDAIEYTKTKRYTHARIRRIFFNAFLGIPRDFCIQTPPYLRVLAFNDTGRELLSKTKTELPIITKPAHAKNLSGLSKNVFDLEVLATDLYVLGMPTPMSGQQEWNISPIYLPGKHNKTV
ncbi:MAG: nucleotidyltransferase family protein [Ruminococcaceae bacterium]|nr:nucleotidyltransferase family protein [Oscillospiraceae bacterium]